MVSRSAAVAKGWELLSHVCRRNGCEFFVQTPVPVLGLDPGPEVPAVVVHPHMARRPVLALLRFPARSCYFGQTTVISSRVLSKGFMVYKNNLMLQKFLYTKQYTGHSIVYSYTTVYLWYIK